MGGFLYKDYFIIIIIIIIIIIAIQLIDNQKVYPWFKANSTITDIFLFEIGLYCDCSPSIVL